MAVLIDNEFGGLEFLVPSIDSFSCSLPDVCDRWPKLKGGKLKKGAGAAADMACELESQVESISESQAEIVSQVEMLETISDTDLSSRLEPTWRDLKRTVIGNQVKWTVTPTLIHCASEETRSGGPSEETRSGGCNTTGGGNSALDTVSNSPTSTLTADTERNRVSFFMSDQGLDTFGSSTQQMQDVPRNLLDGSGPPGSNECPTFDLGLSSSLPMSEDCNSCGSDGSENQWTTFDDIFQDSSNPEPQLRKLEDEMGSLVDGMSDPIPGLLDECSQIYMDDHFIEEQQIPVSGLKENDLHQKSEDCGLELVQQLVSCAKAVEEGDTVTAAAHVERLSSLVSPTGSPMERLGTYFTEALRFRASFRPEQQEFQDTSTEDELRYAYQEFYQACPYLIVTHLTANQAIFEAFEGEEKVHLVDLDIKQGLQWPSLIQALSMRPSGPPQLRITVFAGSVSDMDNVIATKIRLLQFADMFGVPLNYNIIEHDVGSFQPWMLKIGDKETLAVNCVTSLHKLIGHPNTSIDKFLSMIHSLAPSVVTIVEQDANHDQEFFPRFMDALHYYSSMFDSIATSCLSGFLAAREIVERFLLGKDIVNIIGREGPERFARHQTAEFWMRRMTEMGFRLRPLSRRSILQAQYLLGMYPVSKYCLIHEESYLSLGWQGNPLYCISSWY